jgi:hypothetical protein
MKFVVSFHASITEFLNCQPKHSQTGSSGGNMQTALLYSMFSGQKLKKYPFKCVVVKSTSVV